MEKYGTAEEAADNNRRTRIACWVYKATDTHSKHAILIAFPLQNDCTNAPQYYAIRTLPVFYLMRAWNAKLFSIDGRWI